MLLFDLKSMLTKHLDKSIRVKIIKKNSFKLKT